MIEEIKACLHKSERGLDDRDAWIETFVNLKKLVHDPKAKDAAFRRVTDCVTVLRFLGELGEVSRIHARQAESMATYLKADRRWYEAAEVLQCFPGGQGARAAATRERRAPTGDSGCSKASASSSSYEAEPPPATVPVAVVEDCSPSQQAPKPSLEALIVGAINDPSRLYNMLLLMYSEERHRTALEALACQPQDFKRYVNVLEESLADALTDAGCSAEADAFLHEYWERFGGDVGGVGANFAPSRSCLVKFASTFTSFVACSYIVNALIGPVCGVASGVLGGCCAFDQLGRFSSHDGRYRLLADAHHTLGLSMNADIRKVREEYIRLAKAFHPDRGQGNLRFVEVSAAYEAIRAERLPEGRTPTEKLGRW